jgi:hypothetical protein
MVEIKGKGGITASIIADSVSLNGKRITTFELSYPRFIHSEFMTHRLFSRNAASSRAIPVPKMITNIQANTAMPIHWGANQPGMKADNECDNRVDNNSATFGFDEESLIPTREEAWKLALKDATFHAQQFHEAGYHKQIVNRLLEPFQFIKVVCTATEFDNFFWLRDHKDAQPEIKNLAACMWEAREQSDPTSLLAGEWHLPYVETAWKETGRLYYIAEEEGPIWLTLDEALKVSSSCCAQVSYRLSDNSVEKAIKIYDMLVSSSPVHASPFEHAATPMDDEVNLDTEGVTGYNNGLGYVSGNFAGWVQYRQLIPDNACWSYEPE